MSGSQALNNNDWCHRRQTGFTLIEILVVISIIMLLVGILLPALSAARESAKAIQCASRVRTLSQSVYFYAADYDDVIVPHFFLVSHGNSSNQFWMSLLRPYWGLEAKQGLAETQLCPSDLTRGGNADLGATGSWAYTGNRYDYRSYGINANFARLAPAEPNAGMKKLAAVRSTPTALIFCDYAWWRVGNTLWINQDQNRVDGIPDEWHSGTTNAGFLDGHVERIAIETLEPGGDHEDYWVDQ